MILAPCAGGWIPARLMKDRLRVPNIADVRIIKGKAKTLADLKGHKILVVDDIADTGKTLQAVYSLLKGNAFDFMSATLFLKPGSTIIPHFWGQSTNNWIIFPWEYNEGGKHDNKNK